ncbi:Uncharacterised protein [Bordetella pertussis]|nr:Uncharacterised protein [Bordetella pertussis]CFW47369.1 Uncharacterised protein [Bordetella pertussis]
MRPASPEISSTPRISPRGERIGAAWQLRIWLRRRKCSAPCTRSAAASISAVPMALVPRWFSAQLTPGRSATWSARCRNPVLPLACRITPLASASSTRLEALATMPARVSISGWAARSTQACCSRRSCRSPWRRATGSSCRSAAALAQRSQERTMGAAACVDGRCWPDAESW